MRGGRLQAVGCSSSTGWGCVRVPMRRPSALRVASSEEPGSGVAVVDEVGGGAVSVISAEREGLPGYVRPRCVGRQVLVQDVVGGRHRSGFAQRARPSRVSAAQVRINSLSDQAPMISRRSVDRVRRTCPEGGLARDRARDGQALVEQILTLDQGGGGRPKHHARAAQHDGTGLPSSGPRGLPPGAEQRVRGNRFGAQQRSAADVGRGAGTRQSKLTSRQQSQHGVSISPASADHGWRNLHLRVQ